jgi:hypothetical protein
MLSKGRWDVAFFECRCRVEGSPWRTEPGTGRRLVARFSGTDRLVALREAENAAYGWDFVFHLVRDLDTIKIDGVERYDSDPLAQLRDATAQYDFHGNHSKLFTVVAEILHCPRTLQRDVARRYSHAIPCLFRCGMHLLDISKLLALPYNPTFPHLSKRDSNRDSVRRVGDIPVGVIPFSDTLRMKWRDVR